MVRVVNWNIAKREEPWRELVRMADEGAADLALLQEAGSPPEDCRLEYDDAVFWDRGLYDRWPLVVKLSDRVAVEPFRQVAPISGLAEDEIGVSGIGTIAAARVIPRDRPGEAFVAVSMYARWLRSHPSTKSSLLYSDASAHRILSDLSAFLGYPDPAKRRILAAGDLNMFYGAVRRKLSMPDRERTVWDRMCALGLEFLGPQAPHGRSAPASPDDVPPDTKNLPTYYIPGGRPETALNQLDYVFASRGFHRQVSARALNEVAEWGPSDHCRLLIEVRGDTEG